MYKVIIFDLDDTLIDNRENTKYAFQEVLKVRNEEITDDKFLHFYQIDREFWRARANGEIKDPYPFTSQDEKACWARAQRFMIYFKGISFKEAVILNDIYTESLKEKVIPMEYAYEIIVYLFSKGYQLAIATNGPSIALQSKLEKIGISEYIHTIFSADEVRKYETKY